MANLAKLPNLQLLKLRCHAFRGEVWKLKEEDEFKQLKFLLLDDTETQLWEATNVNFPNLQRLVLEKIKILRRIPIAFADTYTLESIELYKCGLIVDSAREIQEEVAAMAGSDCLALRIYIYEGNDFQN